jgi:RimJ/RimL family protein N-acetyltransferase
MNKILKDGSTVSIREAVVEDAEKLCKYMEIVNAETQNLSREPHEWNMTVENEAKFLESVMKSNNDCHLVMMKDGVIISGSGFHGSGLSRLSHKVSLGISVLKDYHNQGVGTLMMEALIEKAKEYHKTKIELDVRSDNHAAIHVYKKSGFKIEGYREDGFFVDGKYIGLTLMGLNLREDL